MALRQVRGVVLGAHALADRGRDDVAVVGRVLAILGRGRFLQKVWGLYWVGARFR